MKSRKTFIHRGFTLIEVLIVLGLITMIAAFGLFISMDVYRGNSFHSEKNIIISVLQKARSRAMNNIDESKHGIKFTANEYIIFKGDTYATAASTEPIRVGNNVTSSGIDEVVFTQLTGQATCAPSCNLQISGAGKTTTIQINSEGRISW